MPCLAKLAAACSAPLHALLMASFLPVPQRRASAPPTLRRCAAPTRRRSPTPARRAAPALPLQARAPAPSQRRPSAPATQVTFSLLDSLIGSMKRSGWCCRTTRTNLHPNTTHRHRPTWLCIPRRKSSTVRITAMPSWSGGSNRIVPRWRRQQRAGRQRAAAGGAQPLLPAVGGRWAVPRRAAPLVRSRQIRAARTQE